MKKITLFAFLLGASFSAFSQMSFEASADYGKLMNVTYDATTPNRLYASTFGNHIVSSNDNGATWNLFYSYPGSAFIEGLKIAPGNNVLTFSTRDAIHFLDLASQAVTNSILVPQNNVAGAGLSIVSTYSIYDATAQNILVDTTFPIGFGGQGKTFYSNNGGTTWSEIYYTVDNENIFINNVAISPKQPTRLFLARGNGDSDSDGGLLISENSGADWTEHIPGIPVDQIAFNPTNLNDVLLGTGISFGEYPENLYRSSDHGETWTTVPITWSNQSLDNITKIVFNPVNPNKIILLEENEIVRSDDNGATWTNTVYEAGVALDYYYGIHASYNPFDENEVAITTDLYPQFSTDGGATLTQIKAKFCNIKSVSAEEYGESSHLYYSAQGGRLHKNLATLETNAYDIEDPTAFNPKSNYMVADPLIPGRLFTYASMGFFGGFLNVSNDYGATTSNILQAFADDMQELTIDPSNSEIIYVSMRSGESSTVTKVDFTDLENVITTDIVTPELTEFGEGVVTGIVINPTNSNEIYIAKRTKVFKSTDGGGTWEEKTVGLEDITSDQDLIWDMQVNPINTSQLTLSSNIGIYTTTDSAENWTRLLANEDVRRVKHSNFNDGVIVGTIFSNINEMASIVYSVDNGSNWERVSSQDLKYLDSYAMDYLFEDDKIHAFIATTDLGVVKYEITDLALGVKNPTATNPIALYPNPASSFVNVLSKNNFDIESVTIFTLTGQKVLESNASSLDVSTLSKGIYVVKVRNSYGKSFVQKLIKE